MGQRGPKPLPANVHVLHGNPSKLPVSQLQGGIHPETEIPKCPNHLSADAQAEWRRIAPELAKLGLVSHLDRAALAAYCQSYARWRDAELRLRALGPDALWDTTPNGYKQISVLLQIANRSLEQMDRFASKFGLSPSDRGRVSASANNNQMPLPGMEEPMETFLRAQPITS